MRCNGSIRLLSAATVALATGLIALPGYGQPASSRTTTKLVSAAGCLTKGDEKGEVWLKMKDGTVYGLEGRMNLQAHLGQEVTIKGHVLSEGKEEAGEEAREERKTGTHETADFRVTSLKVVSKTCK
ncbi:MAG: hypothetical protein KGN76_05370 [Acidobacteriota bacterium]|nr:hypothetical protein [Acidobacteriota bacterium]